MPIKPSARQKRIQAIFYASESGKGQYEESLYEVRHTVIDIEYRTLFFVYGSQMILVHFFKKTSQKTPKSDLDLGWDRMKKWVHVQKGIEQIKKKEAKSHGKKK